MDIDLQQDIDVSIRAYGQRMFPGGKVSTKWPLMFVCTIVLPNVTVTDDSAFPSSSTTLPVTVRSSLSVDKIWDLARMDRRMPKKPT